jgi:hypothetical protein
MKLRSPAVCLVLAASLVASLPTGEKAQDMVFWKETPMDAVVQELEMNCAQRNDHVSCLKFKVLNLLNEIFRKDSYKVSKTEWRIYNFINLGNYTNVNRNIEYLTWEGRQPAVAPKHSDHHWAQCSSPVTSTSAKIRIIILRKINLLSLSHTTGNRIDWYRGKAVYLYS